MAKKDPEPWQPMLLDVTSKAAEPRVVYDEPTVRVRKAAKEAAPPAAAQGEDSPWWSRVRQVQQNQKAAPPPPAPTWGAEWHRLLRQEGWTLELPGGKRAMLENAVRSLELRAGVIEASVGLGSERPHRVQLRRNVIGIAEWTRVARRVVDRQTDAEVAEGLHHGQIPLGLVDAADANTTPLLPRRLGFLVAACTCGGASLPCEHLLAVHLAFARRLYKEPTLLLRFDGVEPEEFIGILQRLREEAATPIGSAAIAVGDPFVRPEAPQLDWSRLNRPPAPRPPLPLPEGWRAAESFDAVVRRIVTALRT